MSDLDAALNHVYEAMEGSEPAQEYSERHNIRSAAVLTVYDDERADLIAQYLAPRIEGKTVVEIGGGIGLLAFHLGGVAKRVYCIEGNPAWAWTFACQLYAQKPKNVSYLFGAADEFLGLIRADIALCCTHSDVEGMKRLGLMFAPVWVDVWGELIAEDPDLFDPTARILREIA